jgi:hypothetical protein
MSIVLVALVSCAFRPYCLGLISAIVALQMCSSGAVRVLCQALPNTRTVPPPGYLHIPAVLRRSAQPVVVGTGVVPNGSSVSRVPVSNAVSVPLTVTIWPIWM